MVCKFQQGEQSEEHDNWQMWYGWWPNRGVAMCSILWTQDGLIVFATYEGTRWHPLLTISKASAHTNVLHKHSCRIGELQWMTLKCIFDNRQFGQIQMCLWWWFHFSKNLIFLSTVEITAKHFDMFYCISLTVFSLFAVVSFIIHGS